MSDKISIIHKSLKIRLYPSKDQEILLNKTFGCCRLLYNERLREHIDWYNANKDLPKDQRSKFKGKLPKQLREEKYEFLSEVIAEPLINSQRNCEQAFSNFFKSIFTCYCLQRRIYLLRSRMYPKMCLTKGNS